MRPTLILRSSCIGLVVCQLAINTIDNAFSTGMDMAGLVPSFINIRRGAYIGLILSIAMCPWQLLSSASVFISVLSAYSVFLGPMVGIYVCEVRPQHHAMRENVWRILCC